MKRQHLFLTDNQIRVLQKDAKIKQIKVSELIRRIIDKYYEDGAKNGTVKTS
jgi:hypothetical protein